ncbi:unnamed protein product [Orchesella dallaii]|uniref:Uncharacterized protein n=1 Tax=Orchesella dallaii TaxID=48710 RepID=A0ABP1SAT3_9HEXA
MRISNQDAIEDECSGGGYPRSRELRQNLFSHMSGEKKSEGTCAEWTTQKGGGKRKALPSSEATVMLASPPANPIEIVRHSVHGIHKRKLSEKYQRLLTDNLNQEQ